MFFNVIFMHLIIIVMYFIVHYNCYNVAQWIFTWHLYGHYCCKVNLLVCGRHYYVQSSMYHFSFCLGRTKYINKCKTFKMQSVPKLKVDYLKYNKNRFSIFYIYGYFTYVIILPIWLHICYTHNIIIKYKQL